jgi:hypothetical protein
MPIVLLIILSGLGLAAYAASHAHMLEVKEKTLRALGVTETEIYEEAAWFRENERSPRYASTIAKLRSALAAGDLPRAEKLSFILGRTITAKMIRAQIRAQIRAGKGG